jgi:hypothetical protein
MFSLLLRLSLVILFAYLVSSMPSDQTPEMNTSTRSSIIVPMQLELRCTLVEPKTCHLKADVNSGEYVWSLSKPNEKSLIDLPPKCDQDNRLCLMAHTYFNLVEHRVLAVFYKGRIAACLCRYNPTIKYIRPEPKVCSCITQVEVEQ